MNTTNSVRDICELRIRIVQNKDVNNELSCISELRIGKGELPLGDDDCEISISKATISVDVEGLRDVAGSRYGEPQRSNTTSVVKREKKQTLSGLKKRVAGGLKLGPSPTASIRGGSEFHHSSATDNTIETEDPIDHLRVRALPNLRWVLSEPDDSPLDATYLLGAELLRLEISDRRNRAVFQLSVTVKQRDIKIEAVNQGETLSKYFSKLSTNQRRLLDIFIAKSLSAALNYGGKYRGEIKLSEHTWEATDDL